MSKKNHLNRRQFVLSATVCSVFSASASAPAHSLRIVTPYPAGGSVDFWARLLKQELEGSHGFSVVAVNLPGASGLVAVNQIQAAKEIQQTSLLLGGTTLFSMMPLLPDGHRLANPNNIFVPVSILWEEPYYVTVRSDSPFQSFDDLVTQAKKNAGLVSFGSTGFQSSAGLYFERFAHRRGMELTHVPYKGMTEIVTSLLGKQLDVGLLSYQQARRHVEAGTFRFLASTGATRSMLAPQVPTMKELRQYDVACTAWFGLFVKKTAEASLVQRIQAALRSILGDANFRATMASNGYDVLALFGDDAVRYVAQSNRVWESLTPAVAR